MLEKLLSSTTLMDFFKTAMLVTTEDNLSILFDEIIQSGHVLFSGDLWDARELSSLTASPTTIYSELFKTDAESIEAKIVHRLQLLSGVNPSASSSIESFLERACV